MIMEVGNPPVWYSETAHPWGPFSAPMVIPGSVNPSTPLKHTSTSTFGALNKQSVPQTYTPSISVTAVPIVEGMEEAHVQVGPHRSQCRGLRGVSLAQHRDEVLLRVPRHK